MQIRFTFIERINIYLYIFIISMKSIVLLRVGSSNRHGGFLIIDDTAEQVLSIVFMDLTPVYGKLIDKTVIHQCTI